MSDSNPQNDSNAATHKSHWFDDLLGHSLLWGVLTLIAFAIGFTPKGSTPASAICLVFAWLLFTRMIYTFPTVRAKPRPQRRKVTGIASLVSLIGIAVFGWWLIPPSKSSIAETACPKSELHGLLIPANEFSPPNSCVDGPRAGVSIYVGNWIVFTKDTNAVIKAQGQDILTITKSEGGIWVSARVLSVENQVIAQITNNDFYVNPSNYFCLTRPNWHTLIVEDPKGNRVLDVYFINPSTIRVIGTFYTPNGSPIIFREKQSIVGGITFGGTTCQDTGTGVFVIQ